MKVIKTAIEDVVIIEFDVFGDARGYFFEGYSQKKFDEQVRPVKFVQDNESKSKYGVLRGLHFQKGKHAQSKLVRVVKAPWLEGLKYQIFSIKATPFAQGTKRSPGCTDMCNRGGIICV